MQTFVSPIGFNTTSVTRTILNQGVGPDDDVVLLRPEQQTDDKRASEAIADVEQLLQEIEPKISVHVSRLPHDNFAAAVMACSDVLQAADGSVIVNFGGGARDILVPLTIATVAHGHEIAEILGYSDIDGQVREWELPVIPTNISKGAIGTLESIENANDDTTIPVLKQHQKQVKSTIGRHVNQLEDDGLVRSWTENRTKHVEITLSGRLYLASRGSI